MWQKKYLRTQSPWLTFCISRWWRLTPVFMTCTVLGVLSSLVLQQEPMLVHQPVWWLRQILILGSASAGRLLPPSWSLDVEMQFYLLAPLLLSLVALVPLKARIVVLGGFLYLIAQLIYGATPETPRLDLYLGCFLSGIWLQQLNWRPSPRFAYGSFATFFLLTALFLIIPATRSGIWVRGNEAELVSNSLFPGWPSVWWVFGALLVLPFVAHNVTLPSPKRDRWLGNLAYPLYMFHWITRDWYYKYVDWSRPMSHNMLLLGASWVAAYLGAISILTLIDQPLDRLRAQWVARRERAQETPTSQQANSISGS